MRHIRGTWKLRVSWIAIDWEKYLVLALKKCPLIGYSVCFMQSWICLCFRVIIMFMLYLYYVIFSIALSWLLSWCPNWIQKRFNVLWIIRSNLNFKSKFSYLWIEIFKNSLRCRLFHFISRPVYKRNETSVKVLFNS